MRVHCNPPQFGQRSTVVSSGTDRHAEIIVNPAPLTNPPTTSTTAGGADRAISFNSSSPAGFRPSVDPLPSATLSDLKYVKVGHIGDVYEGPPPEKVIRQPRTATLADLQGRFTPGSLF